MPASLGAVSGVVARVSASFTRYTAPDVLPADLSAAHVEPTFAGSNYPFGAP